MAKKLTFEDIATELGDVWTELISTDKELGDVWAELFLVDGELAATQAELQATQDVLGALQSKDKATQAELIALQNQVEDQQRLIAQLEESRDDMAAYAYWTFQSALVEQRDALLRDENTNLRKIVTSLTQDLQRQLKSKSAIISNLRALATETRGLRQSLTDARAEATQQRDRADVAERAFGVQVKTKYLCFIDEQKIIEI